MENLRKYCERLGLEADSSLMSEADGLFSRLSTSSPIVNLSQSFLAVLSLSAAAEGRGRKVGSTEAARLAGVTKKKYLSHLQLVCKQHLTDDKDRQSPSGRGHDIREISLQLRCPHIQDHARVLLDAYRRQLLESIDPARRGDVCVNRAVYPCAAVAAACKLSKPRVTVDRGQLLELSGATKKDLDDLIKAMLLAASKEMDDEEKRNNAKRKLSQDLANTIKEKKIPDDSPDKKKRVIPRLNEEEDNELMFDAEEYQQWKTTILKEAGLA